VRGLLWNRKYVFESTNLNRLISGNRGAGMATPRPIQSFAMKMPRWDRIYFFAFSATTFAVLGYVVLLVVPLIEITSSDTQEVTRRTLLADGQGLPMLISLLPVVLTAGTLLAIPKDGPPTRSGKVNLWLSTFLIYVYVIITPITPPYVLVSILFVPAAILITAAAVGAQVRRRTPGSRTTEQSMSGRGGGKPRRNKG